MVQSWAACFLAYLKKKIKGKMNPTRNKAETFNDIIHGDKPVLVDFFAEWCQPCQLMKPILEELRERMGNEIRIIKVDIDQSPAASSFYNVTSVPTLMLFQKGNILWRQPGIVPALSLQKIITQFISQNNVK
jgi:thioredoxin 1